MRAHLGRFALVCLLFATTPAVAQTVDFVSLPTRVGAGLQAGDSRARLSDGQHGGVTVTISVSDSTLARVAPDGDSVGQPSIDVFVPNGSTDATFVVQALETVTGTVGIDASATGYGAVNDSVEIVTPVVDLVGLSPSVDVPDGVDAFVARVGVASGTGAVEILQGARVGGGGLSATFSTTDPAVAELRTTTTSGSVVVLPWPEGASTTPSSLDAGGVGLDGLAEGTATVSVQIPGFTTQDGGSVAVTVGPAEISILGDTVLTGAGLRSPTSRVRLNGSAHGGTTVTLTVLNPSLATVSDDVAALGAGTIEVTIPDGATDALIYFDGVPGQTGSTFFNAAAPGFAGAGGTIEVAPVAVVLEGLTGSQDTLDPVDAFYARIGVTTNGTTVTSRSVSPQGVPVPVTFTATDSTVVRLVTQTRDAGQLTLDVPPGASTTPTTFNAGGVAADGIAAGTTSVVASGPDLLQLAGATVDVTVTEPSISTIGLPGTVGAGLVSSTYRARLGASQHGGTTIRIESLDPSRALLALSSADTGQAVIEGFVPNGATDLLFNVHGVEGTTGTVDITISAPQFGDTQTTVDVVQPAIVLEGLSGSQGVFDPADAFYARIGIPNGAFVQGGARRPGAGPVTVSFTVADPTIARLVTSTASGDSVTVQIPEGSQVSPTSVGNGGAAADGLTPGTTIVSARASGFLASAQADKSLEILQPTLAFLGSGVTLGSGLQSNTVRVRLSGREHGGTTIDITSPDPSLVLVSDDASTVGQANLSVFVPDGAIDALLWIQALDGLVGSATITATASGFAGTGTFDVDVVQPGVQIEGILTNYGSGAAVDAFYARVGVPTSTGSGIATSQSRRAGGSPIAITVTSNDGAVAEIVGPSGSGTSAVASVLAGTSITPTSVQSGGFGLRPLGTGSALITASAPGFLTTGLAQRTVNVTNDGIALAGVPFFLGGGLQTSSLTATLSDRFHGGVTLRIASSDTTRALIAPDPSSPGAAFLDVVLPNGTGSASYVVQGVSGATGTVSIDATAGSQSGSVSLQVVAPALQFVGLPDSVDVAEGSEAFVLQTGIVAASGDSLVQFQPASGTDAPLLVSVVNTAASTGDLVTTSARGDSIVVEIGAGSFQSGFDVASGGIAFDPVLAGPTSLRASAPGFAETASSTVTLEVFGDLTDAPVSALPLALRPNVPNPFNPSTTLRFSLPRAGRAELAVFDVRGRRVRTLVDDELVAGVHSVVWKGLDDDGARVASGVYFARLVAEGTALQQKMVLVQ